MILKNKIVISLGLIIIGFVSWGFFDYFKWQKVKAAAAGFPIECGIYKTTMVTPGCNRGSAGKCSCVFCEASPCSGNTEIQFLAQATPKCTTNFFCVDPSFTGYTGTIPKIGDQALVGATSQIIMGNAVYGTPSMAVKTIDKIKNLLTNFSIAGFKKEE